MGASTPAVSLAAGAADGATTGVACACSSCANDADAINPSVHIRRTRTACMGLLSEEDVK